MFASTGNIRKAVGEYILDEPLFMDSFSSTYQAFHINTSHEALVRIIETSTLSMVENSYQIMQDEINLIHQFAHPNIIKLINLFSTKNNCYLIYEYCSGGSLETYINMNRFIPENEAVKLLHEILNGYGELFARNIILKSIRPDSFILHDKSVKLFDISLVKNFEKFKKGTFIKTNVKFWFSLAPEIYYGYSQSNKCDIWSLGIVFYQMLFGELPWRSDNIEGFFKAATTQPPNLANKYQKISKPVVNALLRMLHPDPAQRVGYQELCKDTLFTNYYDRLQEREQKVIEKIRLHPECWQAASMMYTGDPLISIFDLGDSIKNSTSKKNSQRLSDKLKQSGRSSQGSGEDLPENPGLIGPGTEIRNPGNNIAISGLSAYERLEAEIKSLGLPQFSANIQSHNTGTSGYNMNNPVSQYPQMNQSMPILSKDSKDLLGKSSPAPNFYKGPLLVPDPQDQGSKSNSSHQSLNSSVSSIKNVSQPQPQAQPQNTQQQQHSTATGIMRAQTLNPQPTQKKTMETEQQECPAELLPEFRKYTSRINYLCEVFQLYSQAATSAAKLFKTEFIIFECFFLYKKLLKCLQIVFDAMASGTNVFKFKYWEQYQNSPHFFMAVETVEIHLDSVEDIFEKIYKECKNKLSDPRLKIERFRDFITDDLSDIDTQLNSFLIPYLEKFLPSEEGVSDKERALSILKHKIEIVNVILLNKMPEVNPEEVLVSLKEHRAAVKKEDANAVKEYFNQQYKKMDMFKLNNLKTII